MKMNPVVHFEMPANQKERMVEFYKKAFGWEANILGPEMGEYVVVMTTETDDKTNQPTKPGAINGGFYKKTAGVLLQHPSLVIAVDDIKQHIKIVEGAGGKVLGEPMDIPGVGLYVSIEDTEGNRVSMLQANRQMSGHA